MWHEVDMDTKYIAPLRIFEKGLEKTFCKKFFPRG